MVETEPYLYEFFPEELRNGGGATLLRRVLVMWKQEEPKASWLKGLRILDIGCGYIPYFARAASYFGVSVTGIDIEPQSSLDKKLFNAIQADLVKVVLGGGLHELPQLKGKQFDIIVSTNFVGWNWEPDLHKQLGKFGMGLHWFEELLFDQCCKLVTKNGMIFLDQRNRREGTLDDYLFYLNTNDGITPFAYSFGNKFFCLRMGISS